MAGLVSGIIATARGLPQRWTPSKATYSSLESRPAAISSASYDSQSLFLDGDFGVDDAQGLLLALGQSGLHIAGISAVHGNVEVEQAARNIARLLTLCDRRDIPFFVGAPAPFLAPPATPTYYYGKDGLGDVPEAHPPSSVTLMPRPGHAAVHLAAAAAQSGGELTVVATGPLTNIALASKIDLDFPQNVKELFVMGGAEGPGNATPFAEYNFWWDPEAAFVVLRTFPRITLLPWDCCLHNRQPWALVDAWLGKGTPKAHFLSAIMRSSMEREHAAGGGWIPCDPLAVALAVAPELLISSSEIRLCRVEIGRDHPERGRSVFGGATTRREAPLVQEDAEGWDAWGVVRLVRDADMAAFAELMGAGLS